MGVFLSIKMATTQGRSLVSVHNVDGKQVRRIHLPAVFNAPVRQDLVNRMHTEVRKNARMAHGVSPKAGHQTSAESWGTGRAVARIPRVRGGGTHRSGQGAFGNMCRGGHMFGAKKTWERIHRKVNIREKRYAVVSAIAASGSPAIVMAKGHQINRVKEIPLVVDDKIETLKKTKEAVALLKKAGAWPDVVRVYKSKHQRAGKGKLRNRRMVQKRSALVIYNKNEGVTLAFRNIPGIQTLCVDKLNLLRLAPGGRVGRFIIWSESAMKMLDKLYGTYLNKSELKTNYQMPRSLMTDVDFDKIVKHENVRRKLKAPKLRTHFSQVKLNPLKNEKQLQRLNPYSGVEKNLARIVQAKGIEKRQEKVKRLASRARLLKSREMSKVIAKAEKKKLKATIAKKRGEKRSKTMKKFFEKTRKPRKAPEDKIIMTKEEHKAYRLKKAEEYRAKAKEFHKTYTRKEKPAKTA